MRGERQKLGQKELSRPSPLFLVGSDGSVEVLGVFTCTKSFSAGDEDSQCAHKSNPVVPSERCWGALVVATGMWHAALWEQNPSKKKNTHQNSPSPLKSDLLDSKK